jgi:hypothetical protein
MGKKRQCETHGEGRRGAREGGIRVVRYGMVLYVFVITCVCVGGRVDVGEWRQ